MVWRIGLIAVLLACLLRGPALAQDAPSPAAFDRAYQSVSQVFGSGDTDRAWSMGLTLQGQAVAAFGADSVQVLQADHLLMTILLQRQEHTRAIEVGRHIFARAQRLLPLDDPRFYRMAGSLATALARGGESVRALPLALELAAAAERNLPPRAPEIVTLYLIAAQAAAAEGDADLALRGFQRVIALLDGSEGPEDRINRAVAEVEAAAALQRLGRGGEAAGLLARGADGLRAVLGAEHPETLRADLSLARLYYGQRADAAALAVIDAALPRIAARFGEDSLLWSEFAEIRAGFMTETPAGSAVFREGLALMQRVVAVRRGLLAAEHESVLGAETTLALMHHRAGATEPALGLFETVLDAGLVPPQVFYFEALTRGAEAGLLDAKTATHRALRYMQMAHDSSAGTAQEKLNARLLAGSDVWAGVLRRQSDLEAEARAARARLLAEVSRPVAERDAAFEARLRVVLGEIAEETAALSRRMRDEAPALAGLTGQAALSLDETQAALGADDALVVIDLRPEAEGPSFVYAVTRETAMFQALPAGNAEIAAAVARLRDGIGRRLGVRSALFIGEDGAPELRGFDTEAAHWLHQVTLGPVAEVLQGKAHLYFDLRGAMTALPPHLLIAAAPVPGAAPDWLIRHHAITVLPAISALRTRGIGGGAGGPARLLGFADPVFETPEAPLRSAALRGALAPLPETADELRQVAASLGGGETLTGAAASEAAVKAAALERYDILYFATHGLVAGDVAGQRVLDEPAIALTAGTGEDGFLTASEIALLRLRADWVVLSACNTALGAAPGAEALSGLAQAFIYAGARGLLVSHWPVESHSAVALMTDLFARMAADPGLAAAEAQRQAMLAMIDAPANDAWSHPAYWAPFVIVGTPD